jgi:hypothetical protein
MLSESAQSALSAQWPETPAPLNQIGKMAIPMATKPTKASSVGFDGVIWAHSASRWLAGRLLG